MLILISEMSPVPSQKKEKKKEASFVTSLIYLKKQLEDLKDSLKERQRLFKWTAKGW